MIRKWKNRFVLYMVVAALLAIIGVYFYLNMKQNNDMVARLKEEGTLVSVKMERLPNTIYGGDEPFYWGYNLPDSVQHNHPEVGFDAATMLTYTLEQYEKMEGRINVYFIVNEDGSFITYDKAYVDSYKPLDYFESGFLWALAGISMAIALYYLVRNIIYLVVAAKGVECLGRFEEAYHTKFGSNKYYKVKYVYSFNGEEFTVSTPAVYTSMDAEKLKSYGTLRVKLLGKMSVLDVKL